MYMGTVISLNSIDLSEHERRGLLYLIIIIRTVRFARSESALQWRHNDRDGVTNHQTHDCLFNGLFRRRSKKTSKLRVTGLWEGNSPHKGPETRKMFPFNDVIMVSVYFVDRGHRYSNSIENWFQCNSIVGYLIDTELCTYHHSAAGVRCA